jgi:hypothetical protein
VSAYLTQYKSIYTAEMHTEAYTEIDANVDVKNTRGSQHLPLIPGLLVIYLLLRCYSCCSEMLHCNIAAEITLALVTCTESCHSLRSIT